ncbi:hypothetical protein BH11PSE4_BH11PSE4_24070 [soil metagenome]
MFGRQGILPAVVAMAMVCATDSALAQNAYPNCAITLVLPFAAGSGTDTALGASIVIDN